MEKFRRFSWDWWVDLSLKYTWIILGIGCVVFFIGLFFATRLELRSDFIELLPTDSPSVKNLEHLKERVASYQSLTIAIECPDLKVSQKFAEDLVVKLKEFPNDRIRYIDYNLRELQDFYSRNKWLYADLKDLEDFRDRLKKRIQEETEEAVIESLEDESPPKTDLKIEELKAKYEKKTKEQDKYPDGYYVTPDRKLLAVFVRPPSTANTQEEAQRLVDDVQEVVNQLNPKNYHPEMKVGFTGEVKTGLEEREALAEDMTFITILCLILILGSIIIYYRSIRATILIGVPMLIGLVLAFTVGYFSIGYLNSATAFLSSIVAGNGINFMIILAARFFEEIRATPDNLHRAISTAVKGTVRGTIIAACGASIAYGSLVLAGFRGFRQFGIIGGCGMILCWVATFAIGPALIAFLHKLKPLGQRRASGKHPIANMVAKIVTRYPRLVLLIAILISAGSILVTIPFAFDPFEYDFHNLRNRESAKRGSAKLSLKIDKIFDLPQSPTPVVADDVSEVLKIKEAILSSPKAPAIIGDVKTLFDYLPKDQDKKLAVLAEIREMVDRKIDFLSKEEREKVLEYRPPEYLKKLTIDDVPEMIARPFTEVDGTRGRIIYVYSHPNESLLDGKYLLKFASFLRKVTYTMSPVKEEEEESGENSDQHQEEEEGMEKQIIAVGQAMVFADMIKAIEKDGFRVTVAAFLLIIALLIVAFRSGRALGTVMIAVLMGTLWMIGFTALFDLKLNFLNFVVIPITLGISVDYGANIMARYRQEGAGRIDKTIISTGGAVFLASLTTILGYGTLITSTNMALQSFGIIADIGEFTCLSTAEIVMVAFIVWREGRERKQL